MRDFKWSRAEKIVARRAFEQALDRELHEFIRQAKEMAANANEGSDLWKLESWLRERRREIERKYDFRYSVLPIVFATLVRQGHLTKDDLAGLDQEKIELILSAASDL
jgi:hypothetical protein